MVDLSVIFVGGYGLEVNLQAPLCLVQLGHGTQQKVITIQRQSLDSSLWWRMALWHLGPTIHSSPPEAMQVVTISSMAAYTTFSFFAAFGPGFKSHHRLRKSLTRRGEDPTAPKNFPYVLD